MKSRKVDNIIFLAAGMGTRMKPITINTPKPLVRVNGKRIIDTLLDAALDAGIKNIYIVRGYLSDQFDQLLDKYPMIKFIENRDYSTANNISSVVAAKDLLGNSYICEADLVLNNNQLIKEEQEYSNYLAVPTEYTDDWCFEVKDGLIKKISIGGSNCHHMFGLSYWDEEDGKRLAEHAEDIYYNQDNGKTIYWDQIALQYHIDEYKIRVRECTFDDIVEIDTFEDLKKIDPVYEINLEKGDNDGN